MKNDVFLCAFKSNNLYGTKVILVLYVIHMGILTDWRFVCECLCVNLNTVKFYEFHKWPFLMRFKWCLLRFGCTLIFACPFSPLAHSALCHPILHALSIKWNLMKSQWLSHQMNWWWKQPQIWHRPKKNMNDIGRPILNDLF